MNSHHALGNRQARGHGFSLLEVLIALALSVVIVGAIAMAVKLHLTTLEKQSKKIEYKQIARSVLMMISNDLRNAVQYKPIDYTVLEELAASQLAELGQLPPGTGDASGGSDGSDGRDDAEGTGAAGSGESGSAGSMDTGDAAEEEEEEGRPALVGALGLLSLDVSRIPRLDEYNSLTRDDTSLQLPSDIKTVVYFVSEVASTATAPQFQVVSNAAAGGLYRRQIDRSVAAFRGEPAINIELDNFSELIAPEIAQIGFRYFDGEEWQETWDSLEDGGFPPAIEITVVIDPERLSGGRSYSFGGFDPETMEQFRLVVALPTGEPVANGGAP